jgi:glycosyltransferase involved in cell wall biosynthesis
MRAKPQVSVVMGVHNNALDLRRSVGSILNGQDVDLELVAVDDGSTDDSGRILQDFAAQDRRVRVFRQENTGLTGALIRGCGEAQGEFIARQDADDRSLPGRLPRQSLRLASRAEEALISCWTDFVGPGDELLFTAKPDDHPEDARLRLRAPDPRSVRGIPGHGTAMFRRADYIRAGGYRRAFFFAQDLDLWLRLTDRGGRVGFVPEVLYEVRLSPRSISTRHRAEQIALARIMLALTRAREGGADEAQLLREAENVRPQGPRPASRWDLARGLYFIGRCLQDRRDRRAPGYFKAAVRQQPLHLRSWASLFRSMWRGE